MTTYQHTRNTVFEPEKWKRAHIAHFTGAYAYALNLPGIGHAEPGYLKCAFSHALRNNEINAESLTKNLERDGLLYVPGGSPFNDGEHCIVMRFGLQVPFGDNRKKRRTTGPGYLLLRLDQDGYWSYKHDFNDTRRCGDNAPYPHNKDFQGEPVTDPYTASLGEYDEAIPGFFSIPYEGLEYHPAEGAPHSLEPLP